MAKQDWDKVKALLDNPNVSPDTKREVLDEYLDTREDDRIDDEHKKYIKQYSPGNDLDDEDESEFDGDEDDEDEESELKDSMSKAEGEIKAADDKEGSDKKANDASNQAKDKTSKVQPPTLGEGTCQNSKELFEPAAAHLEMYKRFLVAWNMRTDGSKPVDFQTGIVDRFNEQNNINFRQFLLEADEFTKAKTAVDQYMDDVDGQLISLYGAWNGKAASASSQHYSGKVRPQLDQLVKQLGGAGETLNRAVGEIYKACKAKVDEVAKEYTLTIAGAPPEMAKKIVTIAVSGLSGDDDAQRNQIKEVASWLDKTTGSATSRALDDDDCGDLEDSTKKLVQDTCKQWVSGPFNTEFGGKLTRFDQLCTTTLTNVNNQYKSVTDFMNGYTPNFPKDGGGGETGGGGGGGGGGGTGGGGGGGMGSGGGGGGGTPKVPSMPELPKPEVPNPQDPSKLIDQMDPSKVKVPNDEQTVTIDDGSGRKIQVTEPTDDGKVKLMVTGPDGKPKPYEIDFQLPGEKPGGVPGQPGLPGQPGQPGGPGMPGAPHERLDVGGKPQGAPGEQPMQIKPGPDGTASFRDGNSLITTQLVPGTDDQLKVTIDNMDGKPPATYTVNFEDENKPGQGGPGQGGQGGPGQGGAGGPGGPRAMPLIGGEPGEVRHGRLDMPHQPQPGGPYQTEPAFGRAEPGQHFQPEPAHARGGEPFHPQGAQGGPPPGWQGGPPQGPPPGWQGGPPQGWQGGPPPGFPPQGPPMGPPPGVPPWGTPEPMPVQHGGPPPPPPPGWQPGPGPQHPMPPMPPQFGNDQGWQGGPPQGNPPPPPQGWQPPPPPPQPGWGGPQPGFAAGPGGPFPPQGFVDGTATASAASGSYDLGHTQTSGGGTMGSPSAGSAFGGPSGQPASGGAGLSDTNSPQATGSGGAGLASVPDGGAWNQQQMGAQPPAGAPMGGGMPMGGMGAGAGGGQGGDQERQSSNWRTQGQYFSVDEPNGPNGERRWVDPVLGDDGFRDR